MKKGPMSYPEGAQKRISEYKVNYVTYPQRGLACEDTTLTQQEFRDECDINNIMQKYRETGDLPNLINNQPQYADFSTPLDFHDAMEVVAKAKEQFAALDAHTREKFDNDPGRFLEFATNEKNAEEMAEMGLMQPEAVERVKTQKAARKKKEFEEAVEKAAAEKAKTK